MIKQLETLLQSFVEEGLPGCAIQIAQRGKTLYEGYFGAADPKQGTPLNSGSLFRQASLSKVSLYTAMMMLYEQGKFLMTDPISDFLPEWKQSKKFVHTANGHFKAVPTDRPITIRDVMSMKCGLPYCNGPTETQDPTYRAMAEHMNPLWEKGHYTLREQVRAMAEVPLAFEPGTRWRYGFSSELAACLVEEICGMSAGDAFSKLLFEPLGMENTGSVFFGDTQSRLVKLYQRDPSGELKDANSEMDRHFLPGAENEAGWRRLFSNVNDYTKLMQMLACGGEYAGKRYMSRHTIDMMRANGLDARQQKDFDNLYNAGYGYGYGVRTLIDKEKGNHNGSLGAFGWTGFFGTWCEADPADGVSIVYMHNVLPNREEYYHLRMRAAAYGCIE